MIIIRLFYCILLLPIFSSLSNASELSGVQKLGKLLYSDENLSLNRNQSCQSCHSLERLKVTVEVEPGVFRNRKQSSLSFAHPDNIQNNTAVAEGSVVGEFGSLNIPTTGYAAFIPPFHWDGTRSLWIGGQFWNGRSKTLEEQASQPFLNSVEMAMPSKWSVVSRLRENPRYIQKFIHNFDIDLLSIEPYEQAPKNTTPPPGVFAAFDAMTKSIAEFERSRKFNRFDSKYDYVISGVTEFTEQEQQGFSLFMSDKAKCSVCHDGSVTTAPDSSLFPSLFSNYAYDNLGLPRNINIPGNPEPNTGLGGRPEIAAKDPDGSEIGKHKVVSLRNIELTPPYMHNGTLETLEQVVHFYNTRSVKPNVCLDNNDPSFGINCWAEAEFPNTMNQNEVGNLGLTFDEEKAIVAFLKTLTDNYPAWGNKFGNVDPNVPKGTSSPFKDVAFPFIQQ